MKSFAALLLLLGNVSSASIPTDPSEQPAITNATFSHNFIFLHAAEVCSWALPTVEVVVDLQRELCVGHAAKPEYTEITECFMDGGAPLNDLWEQEAKNVSCRALEILYRNYITIASRSCPRPAETSKIAAQGVITDLALRSRLSTSEEAGDCYLELAKYLYRFIVVPRPPPAQSSTPNWPSDTTTPSFPKPVPTAEPYPVPVPCGSGH